MKSAGGENKEVKNSTLENIKSEVSLFRNIEVGKTVQGGKLTDKNRRVHILERDLTKTIPNRIRKQKNEWEITEKLEHDCMYVFFMRNVYCRHVHTYVHAYTHIHIYTYIIYIHHTFISYIYPHYTVQVYSTCV